MEFRVSHFSPDPINNTNFIITIELQSGNNKHNLYLFYRIIGHVFLWIFPWPMIIIRSHSTWLKFNFKTKNHSIACICEFGFTVRHFLAGYRAEIKIDTLYHNAGNLYRILEKIERFFAFECALIWSTRKRYMRSSQQSIQFVFELAKKIKTYRFTFHSTFAPILLVTVSLIEIVVWCSVCLFVVAHALHFL